MKAENTLQWMMDLYPELCPTRKHALNHLFCVIGNGYHWVNGELVDDDPLHKRYKIIRNVKRAKGQTEDIWEAHAATQQRLLKTVPGYFISSKYQFQWYPLSEEHSYLYNYPDDIKPDWLEILNECKALLQADGIITEKQENLRRTMEQYPDIQHEYQQYVKTKTFPDDGISVENFTAAKLFASYNLSPAGAYNYLAYLRCNPQAALADLNAHLPNKDTIPPT